MQYDESVGCTADAEHHRWLEMLAEDNEAPISGVVCRLIDGVYEHIALTR